jgi:hypothetical protein
MAYEHKWFADGYPTLPKMMEAFDGKDLNKAWLDLYKSGKPVTEDMLKLQRRIWATASARKELADHFRTDILTTFQGLRENYSDQDFDK